MGASGHETVIADMAQRIGCYDDILFLDDDLACQKENSNVIGDSTYAMIHKEEYEVVVAILCVKRQWLELEQY